MRWKTYLLAVLFVAALSWNSIDACLDVSPPEPGSPLDWNDWKPGLSTPMQDAVLSGEPRESKKPEVPEAVEENRSSVMDMDRILEQVPKGVTYRFSFDPWAEGGVTTADIAQHLPWFGEAPPGWNDPPTPHDANYEPNPSIAMRYKMLAHYVRLHLYPQSVAIPDLINNLIEIGQPAQFAAMRVSDSTEANNSMVIPRVANAVMNAVGNPPINIAKAKDDDKPMVKFLIRELGRGYPYDYDARFGQNVIALGEECLPDLCDMALNAEHSLVRENAAYMLRFFEQPLAVETMRKLIAGDRKVPRARALRALIRRGDKVIVPYLIERLRDEKEEDLYWQHFCCYALGRLGIGNAEAGKAVIDWITPAFKENKKGEEGEKIWTGMCALARMGYDTPEARKVYAETIKRFGTRSDRTHQAAMLAQAAIGNMDALKDIDQMMKGSSLLALDRSVAGVALDVLGRVQAKVKKDLLYPVIEEQRNSVMTRYHAMRLYRFTKKDEKALEAFYHDDQKVEAILRSVALLRLWEFNAPRAMELARKVVEEFSGKNNKVTGDEANMILLAIQMLGPAGKLTYKEIGLLLNKTVEEARKNEEVIKQSDLDAKTFFVPAPLFENLLLEMARLKTDASEKDIIAVLLNPTMPARPLAARALGIYGSDKSVRALIDVTEDMENPLVRFFANNSLQKLTGQSCQDCDWMSESKGEIAKGVKFWNEWWRSYQASKNPEGGEEGGAEGG